jgi:hypothetical protein
MADGGIVVKIAVEAGDFSFLQSVQTGSEIHPSFCSVV